MTTLGDLIRHQRHLADLSLRELAALTSVSNAYLSQVERGLHQPSLKVVQSIARALGLPPLSLLAEAGLMDGSDPQPDATTGVATGATEAAIRADGKLTDAEKDALVAVYRSYVASRPA